jgi:AcrR family transcriptional regulator
LPTDLFARDGFEAARSEDIAAEAGRTRGAFYAHFESKAEVFLAMRNDFSRRRARALKERLENPAEGETRAETVQRYLVEQLREPKSLLLQIEFKLFALHRPDMLSEFAEKHLAASGSVNREVLPELFPPGSLALADMRRDTLAIEAILEGFALNILFLPGLLDRSYLEENVSVLLAQVLPEKPGRF